MSRGWVMAVRPLYSEASSSCSLVGMVKGPREMLSCQWRPMVSARLGAGAGAGFSLLYTFTFSYSFVLISIYPFEPSELE